MNQDATEGMLSPYRVLDLTDEKGLFCGKLLGDLGADVIKIERPGGDATRNIGPFYHDDPAPEKSLHWFAFNTSKRGITLALETTDGRGIFRRLVKTADFVIESFPPGYMDSLGLGYQALREIHPGVIMVSITPFGQTGPYRNYGTCDIVSWAMTGQMYPRGDADRPPVRIGHHSQAFLHAASHAAVGAMIALHHRQGTGEGQHVDVSVQASLAQGPFMATAAWDMMGLILPRGGESPSRINITLRRTWRCKDGYVVWFFFSGLAATQRNPQLVAWMVNEGMADDFIKGFDWSTFDYETATQETVDRLQEPTARFFMSRTKAELMEGALRHGVTLYPISSTRDVLDSAQLAARGYWVRIEHPELKDTITYPGAFANASEEPPRVTRRAPLVGEHNEEIYGEELGISGEQLLVLRQEKVI